MIDPGTQLILMDEEERMANLKNSAAAGNTDGPFIPEPGTRSNAGRLHQPRPDCLPDSA